MALGGGTEWARGDRLLAKLDGDKLLLYEPIIVHVELHLDEPFSPPEAVDDPYEANRQLLRLRRRLAVALREPGGDDLSGGVFILEFPRPRESARVLRAMGVALLGRIDPKTDEFYHWGHAGTFTLVVTDEGNRLESNEMGLTFEAPSGTQLEAARIFKRCGLDAVAPLVGEELRRPESVQQVDVPVG